MTRELRNLRALNKKCHSKEIEVAVDNIRNKSGALKSFLSYVLKQIG